MSRSSLRMNSKAAHPALVEKNSPSSTWPHSSDNPVSSPAIPTAPISRRFAGGFSSLVKIEIEAGGQKLELKFLEDFAHEQVALRTRASARNVGVVFAGFGITAPLYDWDDYRGIDVRNKLVIVFGGEPPSFKGEARTWYSTRQYKFQAAAAKGAAGILVVTDLKIQAAKERTALEPSRVNASPLISGFISTDAARQLQSMAGARANISVENKLRKYTSRNVVARIRGSDPKLREEYVVYTAHWDHLGRDSTLAGDQIYNGAIDNAIGTAQLLEIARGFARLPDKPRRSLLFVVTTAEEKGYLGSRYYTQHPLVPIARTVANINLDGGMPGVQPPISFPRAMDCRRSMKRWRRRRDCRAATSSRNRSMTAASISHRTRSSLRRRGCRPYFRSVGSTTSTSQRILAARSGNLRSE